MDDGRNNDRLTGPMERVQARVGRPLREELEDRYHVQGQDFRAIASVLGVSISTVSRWMRQLGIEARFPGQRSKVA